MSGNENTAIAAAVGEPSSAPENRRRFALAVLAGALAVDLSGLALLNAALPSIRSEFGLADISLQWTMTAYAVAFAGFLLLGGRAADVLGRRLVFATGIGLFLVAAIVGAFAPGVTILIIARAAQGIGAALSGPAALALLTEVFPPGPGRHRALAVYGAVGAASFSGGMVLGGALTDLLGWRSVLVFSAVFSALVLLGVRAGLPAGIRRRHPLDLPGAAAVTVSLLLVVFGVSQGEQAGWADATTLASLSVALVLMVVFVVWERHTREPLLPLRIFRGAPVRFGSLAAFLQYTASVSLLFFAPLYMQDVLGYSPFHSGLAVVPMSLSVFLTATFLTGRLMDRAGLRWPMAIGVVLIGLGSAAWSWTAEGSGYWLYLLPGLVISGIGQGLTFPAMTAASLTGVPQRQHGVAGAVNVTAQQIGSSVGVAVLVAIATATASGGEYGQLDGYHTAYLTAAIACTAGAMAIAIGGKHWDGPVDA